MKLKVHHYFDEVVIIEKNVIAELSIISYENLAHMAWKGWRTMPIGVYIK